MKQLRDFLRDDILYDADEGWSQQYFSRFKFSSKRFQNEQPDWLKGFLEELAVENLQAYRNQQVSPKVYSYLLFIWKIFDLSIQPNQYDQAMIVRMWAYPLQASLSKKEEEEFEAAMKEDLTNLAKNPEASSEMRSAAEESLHSGKLYTRPTLKDIPTLLFKTLIDFEKTDIIKKLIYFLYFSYEEKLSLLLKTSDSQETWLQNITDIIPYLFLKNFIPIHDTIKINDPNISMVERAVPGGASHLADPGTVSRVSLFFRNLFTNEEIKYLEQTGQRISETFAHTYQNVLGDTEKDLLQKKAEIMEEAQLKGRIRGLQLALIQYKSRLSIPKYIYDEIVTNL